MKFFQLLLVAVVMIVAVQARATETLYLTQFSGNNLLRIDPTTGAVLRMTTTAMTAPIGIAQGPDGKIYVANPHTHIRS